MRFKSNWLDLKSEILNSIDVKKWIFFAFWKYYRQLIIGKSFFVYHAQNISEIFRFREYFEKIKKQQQQQKKKKQKISEWILAEKQEQQKCMSQYIFRTSVNMLTDKFRHYLRMNVTSYTDFYTLITITETSDILL